MTGDDAVDFLLYQKKPVVTTVSYFVGISRYHVQGTMSALFQYKITKTITWITRDLMIKNIRYT